MEQDTRGSMVGLLAPPPHMPCEPHLERTFATLSVDTLSGKGPYNKVCLVHDRVTGANPFNDAPMQRRAGGTAHSSSCR